MNPRLTARLPAILFLVNVILCAPMAGWKLVTGIGVSRMGLVPAALPWLGLALYAPLAGIAFRRPDSATLSPSAVCVVFAHSCLVTESLLVGHLCPTCLVVATIGVLAASILAWRRPSLRWGFIAGIVLGSCAGSVHPLDRLDDAALRVFWPAKVLDRAPAFVDRQELAGCNHNVDVRILVYEDARLCGSCSSLSRRTIPGLQRDFGSRICIHPHALREAPPGQVLPVMVLLSRRMTLRIVEGLPAYDEVRGLLLEMSGEPVAPGR